MILVVDDSQERRDLFASSLHGAPVEFAQTAHDAILLLGERLFDWLFLDYDLDANPMMDAVENTGFEVAKWLKQHPDRMPTNIIIHSLNLEGAGRIKDVLPRAEIVPGAWVELGGSK